MQQGVAGAEWCGAEGEGCGAVAARAPWSFIAAVCSAGSSFARWAGEGACSPCVTSRLGVRIPTSAPSSIDRCYRRKRRRARRFRRALHKPGTGLFSTEDCSPSIVGAEAFHCRVRDGNGWGHLALSTRKFGSWRLDVRGWIAPTSDFQPPITSVGSGGRIRTSDLRVMSPTSCHCSTPRRVHAHVYLG